MYTSWQLGKHRSYKLLAPMLWNWGGLRIAERLHPEIAKILEVLDKVALGVHQLRDDLLALLLLVGDAIRDLLRDTVDPQLLLLAVQVFVQAGSRLFSLQARLYPHVQTGLLF
jgi:hypothetical protein